MDLTPTAGADSKDKLGALMALFGAKGGTAAPPPMGEPNPAPADAIAAAPGQAKDTAAESATPPAPGAKGTQGQGGLMSALQDLVKFFQAKPGSASNDAKYQKAMTDAGLPAGETGVGM